MSISRRKFLKTTTAATLAATALGAGPSAHAASSGRRSLVLLELAGGNDALNTVIPIFDSRYAAARPTLAIPPDRALMLDGRFALHPAMGAMHALFQRGELAIVHGVGCPNPARSHTRGREVWHRGELAAEKTTGWAARAAGLLARSRDSRAEMIHFGQELPELFASPTSDLAAQCVHDATDPSCLPEPLRQGLRDSHASAGYPAGHLGAGLSLLARLIERNLAPRFFHIRQTGFDTHVRQADTHGHLLGLVSSAVGAFLDELRTRQRHQDVLVMIFSEFGRRLHENNSAGTDHGTAGTLLLAGGSVRGGMYGRFPALPSLSGVDLRCTADCRDCCATALQWLGVDPRRVLAARPERLVFA